MTEGTVNFNLTSAVYDHALSSPQRIALVVQGYAYSYRQLAGIAQLIAARLVGATRVGILAARTLEAYAGVLGTLWRGATYVPISPKLPCERLTQLLGYASLDAVVTDATGLQRLELVEKCKPALVLGPDGLCEGEFDPKIAPALVGDNDLAYVMFTSGTTGQSKGVMIEAGGVVQLIEVMQRQFTFRADDRVSGAFDLTFDPSVFNMFSTWRVGAALFVVPEAQVLGPGRFIKDNQLTVWNSVPSVALCMQRMGMLTSNAFPRLRYSLFGGEALPVRLAKAWQAAAPNSSVENIYGPTEATIQCTSQRLMDPVNTTAYRNILAIGRPFEGVEAEVLDANLNPVSQHEQGELALSGRQLARGYLNDPEMTAERFPVLRGKRWYRTGDLVYRDQSGAFHHLGRIDNQVKVLGHRVELEEVEAHLRAIAGTDLVVAIAWPIVSGCASGIVAFLCGSRVSAQAAREAMRQRVPNYMVPQQLLEIAHLPLGANGKFDRRALHRQLERATTEAGQ
jgi:amino acid adenylation domain-containing protein